MNFYMFKKNIKLKNIFFGYINNPLNKILDKRKKICKSNLSIVLKIIFIVHKLYLNFVDLVY